LLCGCKGEEWVDGDGLDRGKAHRGPYRAPVALPDPPHNRLNPPPVMFSSVTPSGPPPDPACVEAAKPRDQRDINRVVNSVNPGLVKDEDRFNKRPRG
jgi:hypothetical protein